MRFAMILMISATAFLAACDRSEEKPATPPPVNQPSPSKAPAKPAGDAAEAPKPGGPAPAPAHHSGEVIELGTTKIGDYSVRASRDKGELKPGGDAPVDVWVDGGLGEGVTAVRFWIGTEDAKGSVKAKAAVEDGKWHTHVELPDPLAEGTALWIEMETAAGPLKGSVPL